MAFIHLPYRVVATLTGPDRFAFLQGLVTCDVAALEKGGAAYGAFLTPQGKFLDDLFLVSIGDTLYIDSYKETSEALYQKLKLYKLKSDVKLIPLDSALICTSFEKPSEVAEGIAYKDPRHHDMGWRIIVLNEPHPQMGGILSDYDQHRYTLGIPDGARDMPHGKAVLLEYGFDEMKAIDWEKGCYLGQELTARTKYRGVIRKRLLPFTYEGDTPEVESSVTFNSQNAGEVRAASEGRGLALIRLNFFSQFLKEGGDFAGGTTKLTPFIPPWMHIDLETAA